MSAETPEPHDDPREELMTLAAAARAWIEQHEAAGAVGLPIDDLASLAAFDPGARGARSGARAATQERAQRPAPAAPPAQRPAMSAPIAEPREAIAAQRAQAPRDPQPKMDPPRWPEPAQARAPEPARAQPPATEPARPHASTTEPTRAQTPKIQASNAQAPEARAAFAATVAETDDRRLQLALIAEEVRTCVRCVLCERRSKTVFSRGNPFSEICFVGEGPGAEEDARGEPFVGKAGELLDRMIQAMGYGRDDVYICNIVKCRPPENRKPEPAEMDACLPFLHRQIALVSPKVIVALGATAHTGLTGSAEGILRARGKWKLYKGSIPIMPTFHPAYLLRTPAAKRDVWHDLQEVMRHLGKLPA